MSALSAVDLARLIRAGNDSIPAFGAKLSDDDLWAIADYLRSLSFSTASLAQPATAPANQTSVAANADTPPLRKRLLAQSKPRLEAKRLQSPKLGSVRSLDLL